MKFKILKILLFCWMSSSFSTAQDFVDFSREIQPLLAKRCYRCHGPTEQEGGLRLDQQASATTKLESDGIAIVPGKPGKSGLLERIVSEDEDLRMPPDGKPLSASEIQKIKNWIQQGGKFTGHWAFQPVKRPALPKVRDEAWIQNPIDHFVLAQLEQKQLSPAPRADKVSLIRRAYYDLVGLPPTPQQVDAFVADTSEDAYETIIDRLLQAPQYGEKWARHWLDLVRYAETNGYERDSRKEQIWKYRDYVIRAFNEDKSYDRFIQEQIAGDELEDQTSDSITATGIYRLGIWDDEPADRELARYDYLDEIVRTTGESLLGMTIGCARCHDHKIDPLTQRDYYAMLDFFANISPHGGGRANHVPISTVADKIEFEKKVAKKNQLEKTLADKSLQIEKEFLKKLAAKYPEIKMPLKNRPADGIILADSRKTPQTWEYVSQKPADRWFDIAFDDRKWKKGPGGFGTKGTPGSVVRTTWNQREIWMRIDFRLTEIPAKLTMSVHHDEDAEVYLNGKQVATLKGFIGSYKTMDITAAALDVLQTGRNTLAVHCRQTGGGQYIDVGLSGDFSTSPTLVLARKHGKEILGAQKLAEWKRLTAELTKSQSQKLELKTETAMAVAERGQNKTWVLGRGNPRMKEAEVTTGFPAILNPPAAIIPPPQPGAKSSGKRSVLANWIASAQNPMTARVAVNRIWQNHFGRGLVRSSSDFGFQGTPPTHPKLLDWLASEFVRSGWKIKAFHKMLMMSATYQMASATNPTAYAKDPTNDLLWRYEMRR
ncbi:MAG: PSD1 and planctomycete cytochrome C domain-containing protein, partial [Planctomycetota bacterium]|nr:PSD1 and planctomycete cytochrome C domain-containing protein [Planctomycetota bacterium]